MNYGVISLIKLHDSYFFVTQVCLKYTFLVNKYIECMSYGKKKNCRYFKNWQLLSVQYNYKIIHC